MADAISTIIASAQNRLGDLTTVRATALANIVHKELFVFIPELRRTPHNTPTSISLTAGTKEYAIAEYLAQIDYVQYRTSSTAATKLAEMAVEESNKIVKDWRQQDNDVPQQFYITADSTNGGKGMLGLHPTPSASTSGGYPVVEVFGSLRESSDLTTSSTISEMLPNSQVYVEGICYYAAHELRPDAVSGYYQTYQQQLAVAVQYIRTRSEGLKKPPFGNIRS
jgi:hypothetical protein